MDAGRALRPWLAALIGAALGAIPAEAQGPGPGPFRLSLGYDGRLILKVLDIEVDETASPGDFTVHAQIRSFGVLRAFHPFDTEAETHGRIAQRTVWPGTFRSHNRDSKANRRTEVAWTGTDVVATLTPPVHSMGDPPADRVQKLEATDPLTALMRASIAADPCGRILKVFDGKQRYDLDFTAASAARVDEREKRLGMSDAAHCYVRFREVAGFKKKPPSERNQGLKHPIAVGFARAGANGPWVVSSLSSETPLGAATITLQRVR